jgi:hypothetical protein
MPRASPRVRGTPLTVPSPLTFLPPLAQLNKLTIGRTRTSHVYVKDPAVSQKHGAFVWTAGRWTIVDSGSSNGTSVNGAEVEEGADPTPLADGDRVMIGTDTTVVVRIAPSAAKKTQTPPRSEAAEAAGGGEAKRRKRGEEDAPDDRPGAAAEVEAAKEAAMTVEGYLTAKGEALAREVRASAEDAAAALRADAGEIAAELRAGAAEAAR